MDRDGKSAFDTMLARSPPSDNEIESWRSNDTLPEASQAMIRALIAMAEQNLHNLDTEYLSVLTYLSGLGAKRASEAARVSTLRALISPLKSFPAEILSDIFLKCTEGHKVLLPVEHNSYPWKLGHVCSRWRKILWDTPGIWGTIRIQNALDVPITQMIMEPLREILFRVPTPISLSVMEYPLADFSELLSLSHRFKSLSLRELDQGALEPLLSLPSGSFDELEYLKINVVSGSLSQTTTLRLASTPHLRKLKIGGGNYATLHSKFISPLYSQLTDLKLRRSTATTTCTAIYTILQQCGRLVKGEFTVDGNIRGFYPPLPFPPVVAHALEHLWIEVEGGAFDWELFLIPLVVPSLNQLVSVDAETFSPRGLASLIKRSGCTIKTLKIYDYVVDFVTLADGDILTMLRALQSVSLFNLSILMPSSVFVEMKCGLLPALKTSTWSLFPTAFRAFLDFLDFRVQRVPTPSTQIWFEIWLYNRRGFKDACNHFRNHQKAYRKARIYLHIYNADGGDMVAVNGVVCGGKEEDVVKPLGFEGDVDPE